jgi:WhiB family redox-sensing transcriptional regulator
MYRTGWEGWLDDASCRTVDPELFFAEPTDNASRRKMKDAKRVCYVCPVVDKCLEYAVSNRIPFGIYGGLDWEERQRLIRVRDYVAGLSA